MAISLSLSSNFLNSQDAFSSGLFQLKFIAFTFNPTKVFNVQYKRIPSNTIASVSLKASRDFVKLRYQHQHENLPYP